MRHIYNEFIGTPSGSSRGIKSWLPKVLLGVAGFLLLTLALQVATISKTVAADGVTVSWQKSNSQSGTASSTLTLTNNRTDTIKILFKREKYWCDGVDFTGLPEPKIKCFDHGNANWDSGDITLAPGQSTSATVTQSIGGNGSCGSAQVDIYYKVNGADAGGPFWGVAWGNACGTPQHKACVNQACKTVDGEGSDSCSSDAQCLVTHKACQNEACVVVSGSGTNGCNSNQDCVTPKHNVCQNLSCVRVAGAGTNQCSTDRDCIPVTHTQCQGLSCATVAGAGTNQCRLNSADCVPVTHRVCDNQACKTVAGPGQSQCATDNDCVPVMHNVCQNEACVRIAGTGQDQCRTNTDDCTIPSHRECNNQSCVVKSGPGQNSCDNDDQCKTPTHKDCVNEACQVVTGGGVDKCSSDTSCQPVKNQNVICDSMTMNPQSGVKPVSVRGSLSGHTDNGGSVVSYKFNFGDGTGDLMQQGSSLSHTYNTAGTYVVNGYVIDDKANQAGGSGACQKVVTVTNPGVTPPPQGKVLGAIPSTGAETAVLPLLLGSGMFGWALRKFRK